MPDNNFRNEAEVLARLAGIRVPDDRLDALQLGLTANQIGARAISSHDFGATEPAYRFRPPAAR